MSSVDTAIMGLRVASVVVYALAFVTVCYKRTRKLGLATLYAGWGLNTLLIVVNWLAAGYPPLANMYHVLTFLAACFVPLYLLLSYTEGLGWLCGHFAVLSTVPLIGTFFMDANAFWRRMAALQSNWFVPHVMSYMVSYALAAVAFVVVCESLVRSKLLGQDAAKQDRAAHRIMVFALPLMTFGMLSGALWAERAWGTYWSWDPKETWSLVTWTLYVIYLHMKKTSSLRQQANLVHVLAFLALLATFLLVNLMPRLSSVLHSYT